MARIDARLQALEAREQAVRGIRIFQQDYADVHTYYEGIDNQQGQSFTRADIAAVGALGWQVLVIHYDPGAPFATEE
jgi:hypothetical protein